MRATTRLLALALAVLAPAVALGAPPTVDDSASEIFYSLGIGPGLARFDHPQVTPDWRPGVSWDLFLGWSISRRWSLGIDFATWQDSLLGTPQHLHTFAPRVEVGLFGRSGLYASWALLFGFTDGDVQKRSGVGVLALVGYRWRVERWVSLGVEGGAMGHTYFQSGGAACPFVALNVRFIGATPR